MKEMNHKFMPLLECKLNDYDLPGRILSLVENSAWSGTKHEASPYMLVIKVNLISTSILSTLSTNEEVSIKVFDFQCCEIRNYIFQKKYLWVVI